VPPARRFFGQRTPLGKLPVIEDGEVVMCESGAIVEYVPGRHGSGRLAPPFGSPERAAFPQWVHFAESTAFPPIGILVWLTLYRDDADRHASILEDARARAAAGFDFLQAQLDAKPHLLGDEFSAADVMMGFTLVEARPAFQKALATR
jgi:glutathione S-transferase